jgi:hypothetical protein
MEQQLKTLTARLLASRGMPRSDALARKALLDDIFRQELDKRLADVACGRGNPTPNTSPPPCCRRWTEPVFSSGEAWLNNNLGLPRDGVALLVILWALIILPKRERQIARVEAGRKTRPICLARKNRWKPARASPPACRKTRCMPTSARRWAAVPASTIWAGW